MSSLVESDQSADMSGNAGPAHVLAYNANQRTINWERLELSRLRRLGLGPERYSRHFQRFVIDEKPAAPYDSVVPDPSTQTKTHFIIGAKNKNGKKNNSIAPFSTVGKPTCGFFFSRGTDNKKKNFGIPPTNLVKWRSFVQ